MEDDKLVEDLVGHLQSIELAKRYLKKLEERIPLAEKQSQELRRQLQKDKAAYQAIKGWTVKHLVANILGNRAERLQSEKETYLTATLQYNESLKSLEMLYYERKVLLDKAANESQLRRVINRTIEEQANKLVEAYPSIAEVLMRLNKQLRFQHAFYTEILEAQSAAIEIRKGLRQLLDMLAKVMNDDTWINSLGKGLPEDYAVNKMLDEALDIAFEIKPHFEFLRAELRDLHEHKHRLHLQTLQAIEFFKGEFPEYLVTSWILEQKLRSASNSSQRVLQVLDPLVSALNDQLAETNDDIRKLKRHRSDLIIKHLGE